MIEIFVAGHGEYAKGIVSALDMLVGDNHGITPVCAYCGEIASIQQLETYLEQLAAAALSRGNEVVFFTDMPGGSVNNVAMKIALGGSHVHVISGASVAMLLEFTMTDDAELERRIALTQQAAHSAIVYLNQQPDFVALSERVKQRGAGASC